MEREEGGEGLTKSLSVKSHVVLHPVVPALWRLKLEDSSTFKVSMDFIVTSRSVWAPVQDSV